MTTMVNMTEAERREAGKSHCEYFKELLAEHGDKATVTMHADQMRSVLAAVDASDKR
jgi:hypothetical protein